MSNMVRYKMKVENDFKEDFERLLTSESSLVLSYNDFEDFYSIEFAGDVAYNKFYDVIKDKIDLIYAQKELDKDSVKEVCWHAVGVVSGREAKIAELFDNYALMHEEIEEVFVPQSDKIVWKNQSQSEIIKECMSPGYIFIKSPHSNHILNGSKQMRLKVTILNSTVSQKEIDSLKKKNGHCNLEQKHSYSVGDPVLICSGPFKNYKGSVEEIDEEKSKQLKVSLCVLGRPIPVRLAFSEVKKMEI